MRAGSAITGGPENLLLYAAFAQLGTQYYEIPSESPALISDGFIFEQTLLQKGMGTFMAVASGAVILSGAGSLDGGLASSLTQLAIDDEIVQFMQRVGAGFDVDYERSGIDAVDQAGPNGSFMASAHTYKHFRDEIRFYPNLLDFNSYAVWSEDPKGLYERAEKRVADILKRHEVPPLEDAVVSELERILKAADREILS